MCVCEFGYLILLSLKLSKLSINTYIYPCMYDYVYNKYMGVDVSLLIYLVVWIYASLYVSMIDFPFRIARSASRQKAGVLVEGSRWRCK